MSHLTSIQFKLFAFLLIFTAFDSNGQNVDSCRSFSLYDQEQPSYNPIIDSSFNLYLAGEEHYAPGNYYLRLQLFRHLFYTANVRILLWESGYGEGVIIDEYLKTGNNQLLLGYLGFNKESKSFFRKFYKFYHSIPREESILIKGIDYEKKNSITVEALKIIFSRCEVPSDNIKQTIENFLNLSSYYSEDKAELAIDKIINHYVLYEADYHQFLGKHLFDFTQVIESYQIAEQLRGKKTFKNNRSEFELREKFMYEALKKIKSKYPSVSYFGQFGDFHIPITKQDFWGMDNWTSLAAMANTEESSPFKNKVCSIFIIYKSFASNYRYSWMKDKVAAKKLIKECKKNCGEILCTADESIGLSEQELADKFQYILVHCNKK